jgi:hypothetical protein
MSEGSVQAAHGGLLSELMDTIRLLLFTTLWTAIWQAPLPKLSRRVELVAGLISFAAFGLRVFASCFIGVPADDPVRMAVAPLVDWVLEKRAASPFVILAGDRRRRESRGPASRSSGVEALVRQPVAAARAAYTRRISPFVKSGARSRMTAALSAGNDRPCARIAS